MSKRTLCVISGTISLVVGGAIYILFRENSHIALFFNNSFIESVRDIFVPLSNNVTKYYLADFFWGFSLCAYLLALFLPKTRGAILCGLTAFLCGTFWEILQFLKAVSGTGDLIDVVMYLLAATLAVILFLKEKEK